LTFFSYTSSDILLLIDNTCGIREEDPVSQSRLLCNTKIFENVRVIHRGAGITHTREVHIVELSPKWELRMAEGGILIINVNIVLECEGAK